MNQITQALEALHAIKATLVRENEAEHGPICDTIWHSDYETLFDFIDNTIEHLSSAAPDPTVNVGGVMLPVNTGRIGDAAPSAAEPATVMDETGWLVESVMHHWWTGGFTAETSISGNFLVPEVTKDSTKAARFATKEAAQNALDAMLKPCLLIHAGSRATWSVTEHIWCDAATPVPQPASETASVAGLSGDAEREVLTDEQIDALITTHVNAGVNGRGRGLVSMEELRLLVRATLHSTGKPEVGTVPEHPISTMNWSPAEQTAIARFGASKFEEGLRAATADAPVAEPVGVVSDLFPSLRRKANDRGIPDDAHLYTRPPAPEEVKDAALAEARHHLLNTPELRNFSEGVTLEALHQRERWGAEHDAGKAPADWFWLVGYLAGKALHAQTSGNTEKALHHTISAAAALANWHAAITGDHTAMRPGIDPAAHGITDAALSQGGGA